VQPDRPLGSDRKDTLRINMEFMKQRARHFEKAARNNSDGRALWRQMVETVDALFILLDEATTGRFAGVVLHHNSDQMPWLGTGRHSIQLTLTRIDAVEFIRLLYRQLLLYNTTAQDLWPQERFRYYVDLIWKVYLTMGLQTGEVSKTFALRSRPSDLEEEISYSDCRGEGFGGDEDAMWLSIRGEYVDTIGQLDHRDFQTLEERGCDEQEEWEEREMESV
jgi:hypothetical protein